jgi:hypothetical protein
MGRTPTREGPPTLLTRARTTEGAAKRGRARGRSKRSPGKRPRCWDLSQRLAAKPQPLFRKTQPAASGSFGRLILVCCPPTMSRSRGKGVSPLSHGRRLRRLAPTPGPRLTKIILAAEFDRAPRRSGLPERSGGWRGLPRPSRVAPRRRRLRALSAQRLRFADTRVIHSFHRDVGSAFWTPTNSLRRRLRLSPSLRASLSLRTYAPTAPASSRSYGRRSRGAPSCRPGVRGGCRAASSEHRPGLALTPIAAGIWLEGEEPSDPTGALPAQKGKEAPRRQSGTARLEDIVTRRTKPVLR